MAFLLEDKRNSVYQSGEIIAVNPAVLVCYDIEKNSTTQCLIAFQLNR
jgi:hypothetical protein